MERLFKITITWNDGEISTSRDWYESEQDAKNWVKHYVGCSGTYEIEELKTSTKETMNAYIFTEKSGIISEIPVEKMREPLKEAQITEFFHPFIKKISITGKILASNRKEAEDFLEIIMESFYEKYAKK